MRAYVFTDKALASEAGRFVWLEIDTEKAQNAPFKKQFPVVALPTMFIIDPATEKVALRWVGGATVPQLQKILADGRTAVLGGKPATKDTGGPTPTAGTQTVAAVQALARADALYGEGKDAEAVVFYREALEKAPEGWPQYGRTVESLLFALYRSEDVEGERSWPGMPSRSCARPLPRPTSPPAGSTWRSASPRRTRSARS